MASLRSFSSCLFLAAVLVSACSDNKAPTPSPDPASDAASANTGEPQAEVTASAGATASAEAVAAADPTAEPTADTSATPETNTNTVAANTNTANGKPTNDEPKSDPTAVAAASASAAPVEPAGKTFGKKKVESMYAAWLQSGGRYTVGKPGTVQAVVVAKGEYKTNAEYPFKFKVTSTPAGVSLPAPISRTVTKTKARAVVSVPFTPTTAGPKTISGTYYFSVCNESTCKIAKAPMTVTINVNAE